MQAKEFGKEHDRRIVLIPGNMMSWRQFENVIPILEKDFHVIAVSTDGYDERTEFTTVEKSAESIENYMADHLQDSRIDLVFGESFGGNAVPQAESENRLPHNERAAIHETRRLYRADTKDHPQEPIWPCSKGEERTRRRENAAHAEAVHSGR